MADQELIELTEETSPDIGDLLYLVVDPDGTPADRKIQLAKLSEGLLHNSMSDLQGGTVDEYYHLSEADYTELSEWLDDVTLGDNGVTQLPQLVLTPSAAAVEAIEGGMFYNSGDKAIYVCTDI